jgi:peptidoglycan/LPS O-acetylase OafA/YrhL
MMKGDVRSVSVRVRTAAPTEHMDLVATALSEAASDFVTEALASTESAESFHQHGYPRSHAAQAYAAAAMQPAGSRLHGVDFLRAAMMLLGIVLHVALSFVEGAPSAEWMYRDPHRSPWAGVICIVVHVFRMPVFFVMAGVFAALIWRRSGAWGLAVNRLRRIALPLIIGWLVLFPLIKWTVVWGITAMQPEQDLPKMAGWSLLMVMNPWSDPNLAHLWFLYQLLLLCGAAVVLCALNALLSERVRGACSAAVAGLVIGRARWVRVPLLIGVSWWLLMKSASPGIDTSPSLLPPLHVLAIYGVCFAAGWSLFVVPGALEALRRWAWLRLAAGTVALLAALVGSIGWFTNEGDARGKWFIVAQIACAAAMWLIALGGIGVAERVFRAPRRWIRWWCDASYWIYLVHLPLCLAVVIPMRGWEAPALVKMAAAIAITTILSALSFAAARAVVAR